MSRWLCFFHTVILLSVFHAVSTCFGHTRPSSGTSVCCCKLVHCMILLLSEKLIRIKINNKNWSWHFKSNFLSHWGWINRSTSLTQVSGAVVLLFPAVFIRCSVCGGDWRLRKRTFTAPNYNSIYRCTWKWTRVAKIHTKRVRNECNVTVWINYKVIWASDGICENKSGI
jgi:hypothetical protein